MEAPAVGVGPAVVGRNSSLRNSTQPVLRARDLATVDFPVPGGPPTITMRIRARSRWLRHCST